MSDASGTGRLSGEMVVVTGGAQGIGAAIASVARSEGAVVGVIDVVEVDDPGYVRADVTHAAQTRAAFASLAELHGPPTVLVNNAGRNVYADPVAMTEEEWDATFALDLKAAWLCAREVLPSMKAAHHGVIVNIASLHAQLTQRGMFPYAAAKSGLVGLTRSLALEVAEHGVRVNAVSPGYVATEAVRRHFAERTEPGEKDRVESVLPLGRLGTPDEVARVVCFLASREASYVTGADWSVDGGLGSRFA